MKQYNGEKYIVSFTSFGKRIELSAFTIWLLRTRQSYQDFHLVMTVHEHDVPFIGKQMKTLIAANMLEVLVAAEDYGPHLKYFYAMNKYGSDHPIITVDDDRKYQSDMIEQLVKKYESLPYKSIVSNCAIKMGRTADGHITGYPEWIPRRLKPNEKSYIAMAEGFAGILYPPGVYPDISSHVDDILACKYDDDLFLTTMRIKHKVPVTQSDIHTEYTEDNNVQEMMQYNLHNNQNAGDINRIKMCKLFEKQLLAGFDIR